MKHPKCCTKILTVFKFNPTSSNTLQHIATHRNRVAKRMQYVVPNNVARYCIEMLRAFGQDLTLQTWLFHVVALLTTAKKWTKNEKRTCRACKAIVFPHRICKFVTFSLPLSLRKLPNMGDVS